MRAKIILLAATGLVAIGCAPGKSELSVSVDATGQLDGVDHLEVSLTDASNRHAGPYSIAVPGGTIPPTVDFALAFGKDVKGTLTVAVGAVDASGTPLGSGQGQVAVTPSHSSSVTITIDGGIVPGGDGGAGDMAVVPGYHLVFTTQPTNGMVNNALAPSITVTLTDGTGATVPATMPVTLTTATNGAHARVNGNTTVTAVSGVATFDNIAIDRAATGLTLVATADSYASGSSSAFDVAGLPWRPVYTLEGGAASAIAFDRINPNVVVALSLAGTLFESTDGATSWFPIGYGIPTSAAVNAIALDPQRTGVIYAATTAGLYKSTNAGNLFAQLTTAPNASIDSVSVDPQMSDIVFVVSGANLFKSSDGGAHFTAANNGIPAGAAGVILIDPQAHMNLLSIGVNQYWSSDGGTSWTVATTLVPGNTTGVARGIAIDPTTSGVAYFGNFKTTDGGKNWALLANPPPVSGTIVPDPTHAGTIYYAGQSKFGGQVVKTTDGTNYTTLKTLPIPYVAYQPPLALNPANTSTMLLSDPQLDIVRSTDAGTTWTTVTQGFNCVNAASVSIDSFAPANVYVATPADGVMQTKNAGSTWLPFNTNLPSAGVDLVVADPSFAGRVFASVNLGNSNQPRLWSENNGTWAVEVGSPTSALQALVFDVKKGIDQLYAISNNTVYTNRNLTWTAITFPTGGCPSPGGIAVDPTAADNVYVTCGNAFYHGSATSGFTQLTTMSTLPDTAIVFDPTTPTTLYTIGSNGAVTVAVYKTTDSFGTVTSMSSGLSGTDASILANDPVTHTTLYLVGNHLYKTTDGAATWAAAEAGLPPVVGINALAVDPATEGVVYAATTCGLYKTTTGGK